MSTIIGMGSKTPSINQEKIIEDLSNQLEKTMIENIELNEKIETLTELTSENSSLKETIEQLNSKIAELTSENKENKDKSKNKE